METTYAVVQNRRIPNVAEYGLSREDAVAAADAYARDDGGRYTYSVHRILRDIPLGEIIVEEAPIHTAPAVEG